MAIKNNSCTNVLGEWLKKQNDLYEPLTKKQEQELIFQYKDDPDTLQSLLIQRNIRLVFNIAKKYASTSIDFDEMIGRGFQGLCIAARKFDPKRNIKFITYATPWIFKYIVNEYSDKNIMASRIGIPLDSPITDDGKSTTFANVINNFIDDTVATPEDSLSVTEQLDRKDLRNFYNDILNYVRKTDKFDDIEKAIFDRNIIQKDSIREISNDLNLQYSVASRKKKDLLERIREYVKEKYGENASEFYL